MASLDLPAMRTLLVPEAHPCFADHFPGHAILPGALLLQWLCQGLESHLPGQRVVAVKSMKFLETLAPGDRCQLVLSSGVTPQQVRVKLLRLETLVCQGVLELGDDER